MIFAESEEISKAQRRSLMLISKSLQNLANGVDFREQYMEKLNDLFLRPSIPTTKNFFETISVSILIPLIFRAVNFIVFLHLQTVPENITEPVREDLRDTVNQKELPFLFALLYKNMEKLALHFDEEGSKEKIIELASLLGRLHSICPV